MAAAVHQCPCPALSSCDSVLQAAACDAISHSSCFTPCVSMPPKPSVALMLCSQPLQPSALTRGNLCRTALAPAAAPASPEPCARCSSHRTAHRMAAGSVAVVIPLGRWHLCLSGAVVLGGLGWCGSDRLPTRQATAGYMVGRSGVHRTVLLLLLR